MGGYVDARVEAGGERKNEGYFAMARAVAAPV